MPNRLKRHKTRLDSSWSTDQDCLLIENNDLSIDRLVCMLSHSEQEILERKKILGLVRRQFSMQKLSF